MGLYASTAESMSVSSGMATLLEVDQGANRVITITEASVTFSGVSSTDPPVLVEFCQITSSSASGTAVTISSLRGNQATVNATSKKLPATEGTVNILKAYMVPPSSGLVIQYPQGREPQIVGAAGYMAGFSIRANRGAGAAINADSTIEFEE